MIEFFDTISSFIDKFGAYTKQLFTTVQQSVERFSEYIQWLPTPLLTVAGIILILLVIFRILGR